ncbi:ral guanine nucleotide dissociation stimulator-like isoform 1-T2 [Lycaon pictus]
MSSSACVPGHELQSVRPPAFLGIVTPSLNIETEPPQAREVICHWCITPEHQRHEEEPGLMDFPPKLVAEQLTSADVDLFKKVLPQQCLGSIWSKRNEPGNEHLACTVRATITQFNDVANCVITTFLGNPRMTAQDRPWWWNTGSRWPRPVKSCVTTLPRMLSFLLCRVPQFTA